MVTGVSEGFYRGCQIRQFCPPALYVDKACSLPALRKMRRLLLLALLHAAKADGECANWCAAIFAWPPNPPASPAPKFRAARLCLFAANRHKPLACGAPFSDRILLPSAAPQVHPLDVQQ